MAGKFNIFDRITRLYMEKCSTEPIFINRRFNPSYFKLRTHFYKQDENTLDKLLRYLEDKQDKSIMTLTDVYHEAEQYRLYRIKKYHEKEMKSVKVERIDGYSLDDVLNL